MIELEKASVGKRTAWRSVFAEFIMVKRFLQPLRGLDHKRRVWSLSAKVSVIVLIMVITVLAGCGALYVYSEKKSVFKELRYQAALLSERLHQSLAPLIVAKDYPGIEGVLRSELPDRNIAAIELKLDTGAEPLYFCVEKDSSGRRVYRLAPTESGKLAENRYLVYVQAIRSLNQPLGFLSIYVTGRQVNQTIMSLAAKGSVYFLVVGLLITFMVLLLVRKMVLNPILELDEAVSHFTESDFTKRARINSHDEIADLGEHFNRMADSVQVYSEKLLQQLYTDPVTGIANRRKILVDIEETIHPTLILANIDSFKEVNDFYGNRFGDLILKELTLRLKATQFEMDYRLYRMSGDEFALLFDRELNYVEVERIIRKIGNDINNRPFVLCGDEVHVSCTFGAASGEHIEDEEIQEGKWRRLATRADMALREAKTNQKLFIIYDPSMQIPKRYEQNIIWKERLKEAIEHHQIVPYFQPIINNRSGRVEKFECLVRMIDSKGNVYAPHNFLDVAKRTHHYGEITRRMIEQSFRVFQNHEYEFSINLTVKDILEEEINHSIKSQIKENHRYANRLVFEILESEGIENYEDVKRFIDEVKDIGCKIAIDDFGSGYSNFGHMLELDIDYIKIDASLIRNIDSDPSAQVITKTIVNFSKELGLKTISEFVHSREVYEKAVGLGVDYSQGYYFGSPARDLPKEPLQPAQFCL